MKSRRLLSFVFLGLFFIPSTWAQESRNLPSAEESLGGLRAVGDPIPKTARFFLLMDPASARKLSGFLDPRAGNAVEPVSVLPKVDLREQPLTPWADEKHFENALKVSPVKRGRMPVQNRRTACGLNVVMSMLRDLGEESITESDFLPLAVQNHWYDPDVFDFKRGFLAGGGMSSSQMTRCLRAHGARATQSRAVPSVSDLQKWLAKNKKIALKVNAGTQKDSVWHWVRLEEIKDGRQGQARAVFSDPWDGHSWEVNYSVLRRRIHPKSGTIVAEFLVRI